MIWCMRTTLTLDDDVAARISARQAEDVAVSNVPYAARCAFRTAYTPDTVNGNISFRLRLPRSEVVGK